MQAVIIAAGRGVRLKPITDKIPKCLVEVKGKPMLEHIMENLVKTGIKEIHLVVGYKKEMVEEYFGAEFNGANLNYFVQKEPKGTAHAVSLVENYIKDEFILSNADVICGSQNYQKLMKKDEFDDYDALILTRKVNDPWRFGVLKTDEKKVLEIVEKPNPGEEPSNTISTGVYRFKKDIFESIRETKKSERGEFELVDSIKSYMQKGKNIEYRMADGSCIDIAGEDDLKRANSMLDELFPK